jgi:hypothetical protein
MNSVEIWGPVTPVMEKKADYYYSNLYLQILFVSCFKMRKKRFVYLLGLGFIVYFFTTICRHGDQRKLPLPTNFFSTSDIPNLPVFHSQSREDVALYERFILDGTVVS